MKATKLSKLILCRVFGLHAADPQWSVAMVEAKPVIQSVCRRCRCQMRLGRWGDWMEMS